MITELTDSNYKSYSPEEYLELELNLEIGHEYINELITQVPGGTPNHNQLALNISSTLSYVLKRQTYQVSFTDQRLWIADRRIHTSPEVMVVKTQA
jgi:Uma2 family endonuclease